MKRKFENLLSLAKLKNFFLFWSYKLDRRTDRQTYGRCRSGITVIKKTDCLSNSQINQSSRKKNVNNFCLSLIVLKNLSKVIGLQKSLNVPNKNLISLQRIVNYEGSKLQYVLGVHLKFLVSAKHTLLKALVRTDTKVIVLQSFLNLLQF